MGSEPVEQAVKTETEVLAERLATQIFAKHWDWTAREQLTALLIEFAAEIRRSAIEP